MKSPQSDRTGRQGVAMVMGRLESLGFAFREQAESDYGIDGHAELIELEQPTGRLLGIQIKSGPSYLSERTDEIIVFRANADHVNYWLNHSLPVVIFLCDIEAQAIHWAPVTKATAISTGKGYRFNIPISNILSDKTIPQIKELLTPVVPASRYTIFQTDDVSHVLAKRYSFSVVINGTASKAEVGAIVRQVTNEGAKRRYYRNHLVEGRWGDADAHVVWTLIYPSAEDRARSNHICRSQWVNESLDSAARPAAVTGENIGNDILVEWNGNYDRLATHALANTLTKEEYLRAVLPMIDDLRKLLDTIEPLLLSLKKALVAESHFLVVSHHERQRINEIYMQVTGMLHAPFECKEMDSRLECLTACMDNVSLFYSEKGLETWNESTRLNQSLRNCSDARKHLGELEYELKKVR